MCVLTQKIRTAEGSLRGIEQAVEYLSMFQLIGCTLAAGTVILALSNSLLAATGVALLTLLWVTFARPASRENRRPVRARGGADAWRPVYGHPSGR